MIFFVDKYKYTFKLHSDNYPDDMKSHSVNVFGVGEAAKLCRFSQFLHSQNNLLNCSSR